MTQTAKTKYRVRNWKQYNRSLINRGSITFWFSDEVLLNGIQLNAQEIKGGQLSMKVFQILIFEQRQSPGALMQVTKPILQFVWV